MKRFLIAAVVLASIWPYGGAFASAQSMDDLNLQVHGYATQGFIYTTQDSWDTTDSGKGSAAWTDAVVNLSVQPLPKLRVGVQARYFLLGDYGNQLILDWAQADYKVDEHFGIRIGKVKTPVGLLNEVQDIDPAQLWILLPQSIYPVASRTSNLAHFGGVAYGKLSLGKSFGKLEYDVFGGQRIIGSGDGFFQPFRDVGITVPNGVTGKFVGSNLRWNLPVEGLVVGASEYSGNYSGELAVGPYPGTIDIPRMSQTYYFGKYERNKVMIAAEFGRVQLNSTTVIAGATTLTPIDQHPFYGMASYLLTRKLTGGLYYSSFIDHKAAFTSARYQKDWALAARYDFNPFLYLKVEQHFIDGTAVGFSTSDNPALKPDTRMTMLKLGVSF